MRLDVTLARNTGRVAIVTSPYDILFFNYMPPTNKWTHLAIVASTTDTKLYVNGVLQQTMRRLTLGPAVGANTVIGGTGDAAGGDNDPFKGMIAEVVVRTGVLESAEVQQLYNSRSVAVATN